jgi:hypothetical protein
MQELVKEGHPDSDRLLIKLLESKYSAFRSIGAVAAVYAKEASERLLACLEHVMMSEKGTGRSNSAAKSLYKLGAKELVVKALREDTGFTSFARYLAKLARRNAEVLKILKDIIDSGDEGAQQVIGALWDTKHPQARQLTPGISELSPNEAARAVYIGEGTIVVPEAGAGLRVLKNDRDRFIWQGIEEANIILAEVYWNHGDVYMPQILVFVSDFAMEHMFGGNPAQKAVDKVRRALRLLHKGQLLPPDHVELIGGSGAYSGMTLAGCLFVG